MNGAFREAMDNESGAVPADGHDAGNRIRRSSTATAEATPLTGAEIVCFPYTPWHGPWKASQQIMSLLGESNRVLYVNPAETLGNAIRRLRKGAESPPVLEAVGGQTFVYHGLWFLGRIREDRFLGPAYNRTVGWLRMLHVRYVARRLGLRAPILWIFDPMQVDATKLFGWRFLVFHVLDNYTEFPKPGMKAARAAVARHQTHLLRMADLVFAVSLRLYQRCLSYNRCCFLVPNGVNYDRFQATIASGSQPADMRTIGRPVIGYVGVIQEDLDLPLLHRLARELPNASVVLVGPDDVGESRAAFEALLRYGNVHYLGVKSVEDVPLYIQGCDVCILPHRADQAVVDSDQIKLYEYLACGRPIVSTDLPSAQRFSRVVRIAKDADEFVAYVKASLAEGPECDELRRREARQHTWRARVRAIGEAITKSMVTPGQPAGVQR